jgi:membrane dipeptidase
MLPLEALAWWEDEYGARQVETTLALLRDAAAADPDELVFARTGSEVQRAVAGGRFVAFAGLEGAQGIEGDLSNVATAHSLGLRMLGLVHFQTTAAGHPMTVAAHEGHGLFPFGRELISELERLGVVVDLAHLNRAGVDDALAMIRRPCVVSHSGCAAVHPHPRNLGDDQLRAIANVGGVVGIAFGRSFLGGTRDLDALLDHFEHAMRVAGPDAVAIGTDYDGFIIPAVGMGDARAYPLVTDGLLRRGRSTQDVQKALGLNALRVLTEVCG